jgi:hypothetical protein
MCARLAALLLFQEPEEIGMLSGPIKPAALLSTSAPLPSILASHKEHNQSPVTRSWKSSISSRRLIPRKASSILSFPVAPVSCQLLVFDERKKTRRRAAGFGGKSRGSRLNFWSQAGLETPYGVFRPALLLNSLPLAFLPRGRKKPISTFARSRPLVIRWLPPFKESTWRSLELSASQHFLCLSSCLGPGAWHRSFYLDPKPLIVSQESECHQLWVGCVAAASVAFIISLWLLPL